MVQWRAGCITKRTVDDSSIDNKDVVFWDWGLAGFGSGASHRPSRFVACRPTSPANRQGSWSAATA